MSKKFERSFRKYDGDLSKQSLELSGMLGIYLNGDQQINVTNRPGFVYVRLRNNTNEVIQAFNEEVSVVYGLPVIVVREGNRYVIKGRDTQRYDNWGSTSSFVPVHANQHSFNPDGGGGGDLLWVYGRQMTPLGAFPSGTTGGNGVSLHSYQYRDGDGVVQNYGATGTGDLVQYKPTDNQAIMGTVYVDTNTGNPEFILNSGTLFSALITGTEEVVPYLPAVSDPSFLLVAGIRMVSGTTSLGWDNIYDLRQWTTLPATGTSGGGGTNFYDGYGVVVQEDGALIVSGTAINFVGDNVDVSTSGTVARVFITGTAPYIGVYEDGAFIASGTNLSFDYNLDVGVTGTLIHIGSDEYKLLKAQSVDLTDPPNDTATIWMSDGTETGDDGDLLYETQTTGTVTTGSLKWKDFSPASGTVNTGSLVSGTVADVQVMFDGNTLIIEEVTGVPGYDIEFDFYGVDRYPTMVVTRWIYDGSATHFVTIDIYNYITASWDTLRMFKDSGGYFASMTMYIPLTCQRNYVDSNGNAKIRFYHHTTGNASHDIHIDYVGLTHGLQGVIPFVASTPAAAIQDTDSTLMQDSDGTQLLDSDG